MDYQFDIESGIDLPNAKRGSLKYPWPDMDIGDSFLIPVNGQDNGSIQAAAMNSANHYRKRHDESFKAASRSVPEGVRVWRVS